MSDEPDNVMLVLLRQIEAKLDRLHNLLDDFRDDIRVTPGSTKAVQRANDNIREEVRALAEVQSAMYRQINRLQAQVRELRGEP